MSNREGSSMLHAMQLQCVQWFDMDTDTLRETFLSTFHMENGKWAQQTPTREYMLRRLILREFVMTNDAYFGGKR